MTEEQKKQLDKKIKNLVEAVIDTVAVDLEEVSKKVITDLQNQQSSYLPVEVLLEGKLITRKKWIGENKMTYLFLLEPMKVKVGEKTRKQVDVDEMMTDYQIMMRSTGFDNVNQVQVYQLTTEDLLSNDWIVEGQDNE